MNGDTAVDSLNLTRDLIVDADASGHNWAFSVAAAVAKDKKPAAPSSSKGTTSGSGMPRAHWKATLLVQMGLAGQNLPSSGSSSTSSTQQGAKNSFAVAGDISVNVSIDNVEAAIRDAGKVTAKNISVTANNDTSIRAAGGSLAISSSTAQKSVGIAGSVTFNWIGGKTRAILQNVKLNQTGLLADNPIGLLVQATHSGDIFALAAGGAGAPKEKGIAIAGSVAINMIQEYHRSYHGRHSRRQYLNQRDQSLCFG